MASISLTYQFSRTSAGTTATDGWLDFNRTASALGDGYIANSANITVTELRSASSAFTGECWTRLVTSDNSSYGLGGVTASFPASTVSGGTTVSGSVSLTSLPTYQRIALAQKGIRQFGIERSSYGGGKDIRCNASSVATVELIFSDYYTSVSAPTSVTLADQYISQEDTTTLSWSGAKAGTFNAIVGYNVYANGEFIENIETSATSGSCTVAGAEGSAITYTVETIGAKNVSSKSTASATLYIIGLCQPPTSVTASNTMPNPSESVTLSWSGAASGSYNAITGYGIYRANSVDGEYTEIATVASNAQSGSVVVTSPSTAGQKYWFKVSTIGAHTESDPSEAYVGIGANATPSAPTIIGSWTTYSPRPRLLITVGADADMDLQSLAAVGWTFSRNSSLESGSKVVARKDSALTPNIETTISITQSDPNGASATATTDLTYEPIAWTDNPVKAGETVIKAAHINEIRSALEDICIYYGMETPTWAEEIVAGETSDINFPLHVAELMTVINSIASRVNAWDTTTSINNIIFPSVAIPSVPTAATINQIRQIITML